jgi:hypothetical protein
MPTKATIHLYINNVAVNVDTLTKKQSAEFRRALLAVLKPANKNCYLELDLDSSDEYGILTCTDENDMDMSFPVEVKSRTNKYVYIPVDEWNPEHRTTILISMA